MSPAAVIENLAESIAFSEDRLAAKCCRQSYEFFAKGISDGRVSST